MRTWLRSKVTLLFLALGLLVAIPAVALADNIVNDIDTTVHADSVVNATVGETVTVGYLIQATGTGQICDAADGSKATLTPSKESGPGTVAVSPTFQDYTACDTSKTFNFKADTPGDYVIAVAVADTNGDYNTTTGKWKLRVAAAGGGNAGPTANAGGSYAFDEGSATNALSGSGTDPEDDAATPPVPLTYAWDLDNNGTFETSGQNPNFNATNFDGPDTRTVTLRVTDSGGLSDTDSATVTINNVAPTAAINAITKPDGSALGSVACLAGNTVSLDFSFTDPAAADTHSASIDWDDPNNTTDTTIDPAVSPEENVEHTYSGPGSHTIVVTVTDDNGGSDSADNSASPLSFHYNMSGILPPFNPDGTSTFKYGSTVPVKVKITDCAGTSVPGLAPKLGVRLFSPTTPVLGINEEIYSTSNADTGNTLRYDASAGQYIYNYNTKSNMTPDSTASYYMIVEEASSAPNPVSQKFGLKLR
jgi:hypothetical protein